MNHLLYIAALGAGFIPFTPPKLVVAPFARCAPLPSRSQCLDPGFWQRCADRVSEAGRLQCAALARAELDALGQLPEVTTLDDAGAARAASVVADYEDTPSLSGLLGGASGSVLELVAHRRDSARVTAADRRRFADNCSVTSCDEYIFDKYFDLVDFEVRTAEVFDDPVARFGELYGAEGLARRRLRDIEGRPISGAPITLERRRGAKNNFLAFDIQRVEVDWHRVSKWGGFGVPQGPNIDESLRANCNFDADSQRFSCGPDATNRDLLAAEQANQALVQFDGMQQRTLQLAHTPTPPEDVDPWDFHAASASTLAGQPPELLLELYEAGEAFAALSERRYAAAQRVSDLVGWMDFFDRESELPPDENLRMIGIIRRSLVASVTELRGIDTEVNERLAFADRAGCLANGSLGPCDWSHQWVLDEVDQLFIEERERDYQRCVAVTGGDFSLLHAETGRHWLQTEAAEDDFCTRGGSPVPNCRVQQSYIATPDDVETYFSTVEAWFESLPVPRDSETGELLLGQGAGDEARLGDGRFGAGYDYGVGYTSRRWQDGFCAAELDTSAHLNSDVSAFGVSSSRLGGLLRTSVNTQAGPNGASASVAVRVLGLDIYVPDDFEEVGPDALRFAVAEVQSEAIRHGLQESFLVGPIPFVAKAGFAGEVGLQFDLQGGQSGCPGNGTLSSEGTILPFAKLGAYAGAAAGIDYLASAGVRTKLTLLDFGLPFALETRFPAAGRFDVSTDLSARWAMLRGRVELYAELGPKEWKRTLVRWPGHSGRTGYWSRRYGGDSETLVRLASGGDAGRSPPPDLTLDSGRSCRAPVQLPAPTLYFSFDDTTVDTANRTLSPSVGSADASFGNAVQPGRSGLVAQSFAVDGTQSDGALLVSDWGLRTGLGRGAHTMSLWFNPGTDPAAVGGYDLLGFGDTQAGFRLWVDSRGRLVFERYDEGGVTGWNTLLEVQRNLWQPLLLEIGGGDVRVTLGRASAARSSTLDLGGSALRIGSALGSSRSGWSGQIDELAAWSAGLSLPEQAEVKRRGGDARPLQGAGAALPVGGTELVAEPRNGSVALRWTNPPGLGAEFSATQIYVGFLPVPDDRSGALTAYAGTESVAEVAPLQNGTTYHFRAFAVRPDGSVVAGPSAVATPSAATLPAPTNVTASSVSGGVLLSWDRPASARYDQMIVVRRTDRAPLHPLDGRVIFGLDDIEHLDTGLAAAETGFYGIAGVDTRRQFGPMVTVQGRPGSGASDHVAPGAVSDLSGTSDGTSVTLRWTAPRDSDLAGVRVERSQGNLLRYTQVYEGSAQHFVDGQVRRGLGYRYRVTAFDQSHNQSVPRSVRVTVDAAPAPVVEGLSATESGGLVTVSWTAPSDRRIRVRRSRLRPVSSPTSGTGVHDGTGTSFTDANASVGAVYYTAFAEGDAGPGTPRSVRVEVGVDTPPDPVSRLAGAVTEQGLALSWQNPSDSDLAAIEVRHATTRFDPDDASAPGVTTAQSSLASSALIDAYGTQHIAVVAVDGAGQRSSARWLRLDRPIVFSGRLSCPLSVRLGSTAYLNVENAGYSDGSPIGTGEWRLVSGPTVTVATQAGSFHGVFVAPLRVTPLPPPVFQFEFVADGVTVDQCSVQLDVFDDNGIGPAEAMGVSSSAQVAAPYGFTGSGHLGLLEGSDLVLRDPTTGSEAARVTTGLVSGVAFDARYAYLTYISGGASSFLVYDMQNISPSYTGLVTRPGFIRTFPFASGGLTGSSRESSPTGLSSFALALGPPLSLSLGAAAGPAYTPLDLMSLDPSASYVYAKPTTQSDIRILEWPAMSQRSTFQPDASLGDIHRLDTVGGRLFALGEHGFQVFDITTPTSPSSLFVDNRPMLPFRRTEGSGNFVRFVPEPGQQFWGRDAPPDTDAYLELDLSNPSNPTLGEFMTPGLNFSATVGGAAPVWTLLPDARAHRRFALAAVPPRRAPLQLPIDLTADPLYLAHRGDQMLWVDPTGVQLAHYDAATRSVVLDARINQALVPTGATEYPHLFHFVDDRVFIPSARANGGVFEVDLGNPSSPTGRTHFSGSNCIRAARTGRFLIASCDGEVRSIDSSNPSAPSTRLSTGEAAVVPVDGEVWAIGLADSQLYGDDGGAQPALVGGYHFNVVGWADRGTVVADVVGDRIHLCCHNFSVQLFSLSRLRNGSSPTLIPATSGGPSLRHAAAGPSINWYINRGGDLFAQRPTTNETLVPKQGAEMYVALPLNGGPKSLVVASDDTVIIPFPGRGLSYLRPSRVELTATPSGGSLEVAVRFDASTPPIRHALSPEVRCHGDSCVVLASDIAAGTATVRWFPPRNGRGHTLRVSVGDAFGFAVGTVYGEAQ